MNQVLKLYGEELQPVKNEDIPELSEYLLFQQLIDI